MTSPRSKMRKLPALLLLPASLSLAMCSSLTRTLGIDKPAPHDAAKVTCETLPFLEWTPPDNDRALKLLNDVAAGLIKPTAAILPDLRAALGDTPETVWQTKVMNGRRDGLQCSLESEVMAALPPLPANLKGEVP